MFAKIARFELRYQIKNPVFWVAVILFFLLTFGAMASEQIQIGGGGNTHKNSPVVIMQMILTLTLFFMFVTTAFVANVVVRDDDTNFGPIIRSTRVTKLQYLLGRFSGATLAAALAFMVIPLGIWFGSLMPWIDAETLGPNRLRDYAYGYFVFGLPNLVVTAAIFFAAATITRSMMWTYVAVIIFFLAWVIMSAIAAQKPEFRDAMALGEPFGIGAFGKTVRYWTAAERNTMLPPIEGVLLMNRLLWLTIGAAFLALAVLRYRFTEGSKVKKARKAEKLEKAEEAAPAFAAGPLPAPSNSGVAWTQL